MRHFPHAYRAINTQFIDLARLSVRTNREHGWRVRDRCEKELGRLASDRGARTGARIGMRENEEDVHGIGYQRGRAEHLCAR